MLMLTLIALLISGVAMYRIILWFNRYTSTHAAYEFFTTEHSIAMIGSYALIYFGERWMHNSDDWLNGAIVMGIGIIILLGVILNNFARTPKLFAIAGSLAQLIFYIPIALGAVIIVAFMMAWISQTKPVIALNARD